MGNLLQFCTIFVALLFLGGSVGEAQIGADEGAEDARACAAAGGRLIVGRVTAGPVYVPARVWRKGVALSHSHLTLLSEADGRSYDIAIDNLFAAGYDSAGQAVPEPLAGLARGDRLSACGQPYSSDRAGLHWVHTNCGKPPTAQAPDGWLRKYGADGRWGPNLDSSTEYCSLW